MKLQKFPILALAILGALSFSATDLWAHGGGHSGRGGHFGGGGARFGGGARVGFGGARFGGGHFAGRPAFVGERFGHFAHRRGFNNVVIAGGPAYNYYPYYGAYPYGYYNPVPPATYANDAYAPVVVNPSPGLVAGDVVGNVQRVLRYRGFYRGPIDGLSGPATRAAIRAYDASVGLPPTGSIDARLLISMQLM